MATALESTSPQQQRWLTIIGAFALAALAGVAFAAYIQTWGDWHDGMRWEREFMTRMHNSPLPRAIDASMLVFPWFGTNISLMPAVGLMVWWLWRKRHRTDLALQLAVVQIGSFLLNPSLKGLTDRQRPDLFPLRGWYGWASYPSGHAITSVAVLMTVAIVLHRVYGWRWPYYVLGSIMLASLYSRVYLGVHWPTDVIGGAMIGAVWLAGTMYAFRDTKVARSEYV